MRIILNRVYLSILMECLVFMLILPQVTYADSPITSTDFYKVYLDIEIVKKAKDRGVLTQEIANYLLSPTAPIDVKAAIINAISWKFGGDNVGLFLNFLQSRYKKPKEMDIEKLDADELFCLGYLTAMEDYCHPKKAIPLIEMSYMKRKDSFTIASF